MIVCHCGVVNDREVSQSIDAGASSLATYLVTIAKKHTTVDGDAVLPLEEIALRVNQLVAGTGQ